MRVVLDSGEVIQLGTVETAPTIGIIDYSRRVTDDYGVTTVVERGFARRMSVRLAVPADDVDALQLRLAALRATPAQWIADDDIAWLSVAGFYKDFSIDLAIPPISYCTLTIEGLTASPAFADPGGDPSPDAQSSTLQLLQPIAVTDAMLASSSVDETDYPEWAAGTSYPFGARVIKAATHRIYESAASANLGDDPTAASGKWFDVGPTSRWACFDRALGSVTTSAAPIVVALDVTAANAVALLDVVGSSVRVQAPGYDRTIAVASGPVSFLDLPTFTGRVTVTIAGSGMVSVGTLLVGRLLPLGITEASPSAGITDYSRKAVDDFGQVTVSQRAYAKRMSATALIRTDAIDLVAGRIASVRALPALWIGDAARGSLTVFGFFKDFSVEVGENVSKLSLSIEGLSTAGKVEPLTAPVAWPDVTDPTGTKPADNADVTADNTSKDTVAVGGRPTAELLAALDRAATAVTNAAYAMLQTTLTAQDRKARYEFLTHIDGIDHGTVIKRIDREWRDGDKYSAERVDILGALSGDGLSFVIDIDRVEAEPGKSLAQRFVDIVAEAGTAADGKVSASAQQLTQAIAQGDSAVAQAVTDLHTHVDTQFGSRDASYTNLVQVINQRDAVVTQSLQGLTTTVGGNTSDVQFLLRSANGLEASAQIALDVNGRFTGFKLNGATQAARFSVNTFTLENPSTGEVYFFVDSNGKVIMRNVVVDTLEFGAMDAEFVASQYQFDGNEGTQRLPGGVVMKWGRYRGFINDETQLSIVFVEPFPSSCDSFVPTPYLATYSNLRDLWLQNVGTPSRFGASVGTQSSTNNSQRLDGFDWIAFGR